MYRETGSIRFDKELCIRAHALVFYDAAPGMFSSISLFADHAFKAKECETMTLDGVCYRHRVLSPAGTIAAEWHNPDPDDHPMQVALVSAYKDLIRAAKIKGGQTLWLGEL